MNASVDLAEGKTYLVQMGRPQVFITRRGKPQGFCLPWQIRKVAFWDKTASRKFEMSESDFQVQPKHQSTVLEERPDHPPLYHCNAGGLTLKGENQRPVRMEAISLGMQGPWLKNITLMLYKSVF